MRPRPMTSMMLRLAVATSLLAPSAMADETSSRFDLFAKRCLDQGPRYDRTVAFAKEREWTALAEDITLGIVPLNQPTAFDGWIVQTGGDKPFEALVVAKASVGGKAVESCSMAFAGIGAEQFERFLTTSRHAIPSGQQSGAVRSRKFFTIDREGSKEAVTLDLPLYPNGADEVVASVVAEQQIEN